MVIILEKRSTAVQELAFTLSNGFAYLDACIERGLSVDDVAPRLSFSLIRIQIFLRKYVSIELQEEFGQED